MPITKIRKIHSVDVLANEIYRAKVVTTFTDSSTGLSQTSADPEYITLDLNKPAHRAAIRACKSALTAVGKALGTDA